MATRLQFAAQGGFLLPCGQNAPETNGRSAWSHSFSENGIVSRTLSLGVLAKVFVLDRTETTLYSWQVHPARERRRTALLTLGVIAAIAWLTIEVMQQPAWGLFALVVLLAGCNRFFFPTRYELDAEGLTARYPLRTVRYRWVELRRFVYDGTGGFLSPRVRRSLLDEYRGISLLFPKDAETIISKIRSHLPSNAVIREVADKTLVTREGGS